MRLVRSLPAPRLDNAALRVVALLVGWTAITFALLVYWITQATGSQGRLLFPAISAFAILLAFGLDYWLGWLPTIGRRVAWSALLVMMLGASIFALVQLLPASYTAPPPLSAVPAAAQPVDIVFGDDEPIKLLAIDLCAWPVSPR